ncbi:852_t:CDS:2 [Acaulospora morrowiae]|uniref:852_t:CDS:1 n=1 Tax=Acaulospora morrowiae TaxID=94023 RepID=A0A9N8YU53_9GLOM|nr:852_t:CDS:2 [Acaulospora morrowiae]
MAEDKITFQVNFKGTIIQIENWTTNSTIRELKEHLTVETKVPVEFQKLIYKGLLKDDETLQQSKFKCGIKVMLIGSSQQEVQSIKVADEKLINQPTKSKYSVNPYKNVKRTEDLSSNTYTFHQIEVIEHFPNPEKARALLERLRDDRGIRAIMLHYKWSVGTLRELSPAERTILGLNRNAGQEISLRLRTDDMEGFRNYTEVRKVLLHELTHNVWGKHDDNFHRLNRQLNKDVLSMDWTASGGHKLSNSDFYNPLEGDVNSNVYEGGIFKLGGDSTRTSSLPRRELLAEAALIRLTKEEQELNEGCGSENYSGKDS